jgi:acyl-CoA synthetase (AMP-forming)/AMP-acid ligase II
LTKSLGSYSPNSLAWPIVYFGLQTVAVTTTLANSAYTPPELAHQIKDSDASLLFVHPLLFPTLLAALELLKLSESEIRKRVVIMSYVAQDTADERSVGIDARWTRLGDLLKKGKLKKEIMLSPKETDQTAMMCYSSGIYLRPAVRAFAPPLMKLNILFGAYFRHNGAQQGCADVA